MADVFDTKKRSEVMSRIRGKGNKSTELALAEVFRQIGIKGWRRQVVIKLRPKASLGPSSKNQAMVLVIKPDFVFRRERVAVFTDGCFWHRCPRHSNLPEGNREFWQQKLARNVERDRLANRELKKAGWRVVRVWEHELAIDSAALAEKLLRSLHQTP